MGLWLKCPGCQAQNPLSLRVCPYCGRGLDKLPAAQRVYVIGPAPAPPPKASAATPPAKAPAKPEPVKAGATSKKPSPKSGEAAKTAEKPKRTRKKTS
jgi:hypothetical protein